MNFDKDIWSGDKTGQVSQKHQRTSPIKRDVLCMSFVIFAQNGKYLNWKKIKSMKYLTINFKTTLCPVNVVINWYFWSQSMVSSTSIKASRAEWKLSVSSRAVVRFINLRGLIVIYCVHIFLSSAPSSDSSSYTSL